MFCIVIINLSSCSKKTIDNLQDKQEIINAQKSQDNLKTSEAISQQNEQEYEQLQLKIAQSSYMSIDNLLKSHGRINEISWTSEKTMAVFSMSDNGWDDEMFIWQVGHEEPQKIEGINDILCSFIWSPDGKYVIADSGTSVCRSGYVVGTEGRKLLYKIGYIGEPFWSPDSKYIAIAQENEIKAIVETELDGTTDIYLLDIESMEKRVIDEGTPEYSLWIKEWTNDGNLVYEKCFYKDNSSEEVTYDYKN